MSNPQHNRALEVELRSLVNAVLEGTADTDEMKQLGRLLERHPHLLPRYVDHFVIDTNLSWDAIGDLTSISDTIPCEVTPVSRERWAIRWGGILAIAGALMLFAYFMSGGIFAGNRVDALAQVITLTPLGTSPLKAGDPLEAGLFQLSDGETATLKFRTGSQLYCEGPCKLDLISPQLVSLEHGKVTADVPPPAIGFTVLTKRLQVTDLGTRFGVNVDNSEDVDVVVFDGEVNLSDRQGKVKLPQGLYAGEALRVGQSDHFERLVSIGHDPLSKSWTSSWQTDTNLGRSIFTRVTDNLALDSEPNFYGIVPRGLVEDTRAYSDRVHEWNSLPGRPLPAWLRGADLIRRFNSRKYDHSSQLEVNLAVSTECALFVIWDRRCNPPAWLTEQFKDTNYILGMDEGPYKDGIDTLDVGAGKSIDTTYAVWAAKVGANEEVRLGVLGNEHLGKYKNLYGMAAKPLERISPEHLALLFETPKK